MSSDQGEKQHQKEEVLRLFENVKREGQGKLRKSSESQQHDQYILDLADASHRTLKYVDPSDIDWLPIKNVWQEIEQQQVGGLRMMLSIPTATGTAGTAIMAPFTEPEAVNRFVVPAQRDAARADFARLSVVIERGAQKDLVSALLRQYGFAKETRGQRSAAELFDTAYAAYEKPVGQGSPATTSLIPMRECINIVIAELLRSRPMQEPAKSEPEKIRSVIRQLRRANVSEAAIERLGLDWQRLNDELSESKQKKYSREQWHSLLRKATLFLKELLESLNKEE